MIHRFQAEIAGGKKREVTVEKLEEGRYRVSVAGKAKIYDARRIEGNDKSATWALLADGGGAHDIVDVDGRAPDLTLSVAGQSFPLKLTDAKAEVASRAPAPVSNAPQGIASMMPGKVVKVLVKAGDPVKAGQGVIVVEAMKMENELKANRDGVVGKVNVVEGAAVEAGQILVTLG